LKLADCGSLFFAPPLVPSHSMGDLKDEVVDTAKRVAEVFTIQYTKAYALSLVRICKEEVNAPPEPDWKLQKRPVRDALVIAPFSFPFSTYHLFLTKKWTGLD
jgi:hypothetical protein